MQVTEYILNNSWSHEPRVLAIQETNFCLFENGGSQLKEEIMNGKSLNRATKTNATLYSYSTNNRPHAKNKLQLPF